MLPRRIRLLTQTHLTAASSAHGSDKHASLAMFRKVEIGREMEEVEEDEDEDEDEDEAKKAAAHPRTVKNEHVISTSRGDTVSSGTHAPRRLRQRMVSFFNSATYDASLLLPDEFGSSKTLEECKEIHNHVRKTGFKDIYLANHLILMYNKYRRVGDARKVFDQMPARNVFSWNAMISGYSRHANVDEASQLFYRMKQEGIEPDKITFISILKICCCPEVLELGKVFHAHIVTAGFGSDPVVGTALVNMYCKCGSIEDARIVFDNMHKRDVVSWTTIIAAHAQKGNGEKAFGLFQQMVHEGVRPDRITFTTILSACASPEGLPLGKLVHARIIYEGFETNVIIGTALVNMYGKCRSVQGAQRVFSRMPERNVATWNTIICVCAWLGHSKEAFKLFQQMQQEGLKPDKITCLSIMNICADQHDRASGKLAHAYIVDAGFESDAAVGTLLVKMYGKCRSIDDARRVFRKMPQRDVLMWTAIIGACAHHHGYGKEAFKLFKEMQSEKVQPDNITLITILNACASSETLALGKLSHIYAIEQGFESDVAVGTALVNMYGKCGSMEEARNVFNKMPERNLLSWTAMVTVSAQHGSGKEALEIFQQMQREGVKPNEITFISILYACSHAGLLEEGLYYFNCMTQDYAIVPNMGHFNCMVDLLGRAGCLDEAEDIINRMPFQPDGVIWMTLLGSCRAHGYIDQGICTADHAVQLDPQSDSAYVVLSNIYAASGRCGKS